MRSVAVLIAPRAWSGGDLGGFHRPPFSIIPLPGLARVSEGHAGGLFGPAGWRKTKLLVLFDMLNLLVSLTTGTLVRTALGASPNPAVATAGELSPDLWVSSGADLLNDWSSLIPA